MYPSSNPTGEASIHHYGNFSYLAEFSTDGLKKMKKKSMSQTLLYEIFNYCFSVIFDSLWPHGLQHATLHCPSPSPGNCSNSCPLVSDAIQPFHPLGLPSPTAHDLSQHQGLFQWVGCLHQVAKVSELQLQHQSFQWILRIDFF